MKYRLLPSQERLKELFDYNEVTGVFIRKTQTCNKVKAGDIAGSKKNYVVIRVDNIEYSAHRLAWMYMTGEDPLELQIDHKDENKHNNAFSNLRKATNGQNTNNRGAQKNNKLGIKGVIYDKFHRGPNKYRSEIRNNGKKHHLGYYSTPELAHEAYKTAALELHGEFANFG